MSERRKRDRTFSERVVIDGPPFLIVAFLFVLLETSSYGIGHPGAGLAILASGLLLTVWIDFATWRRASERDRIAAVDGLGSLLQRLAEARARDLERDRWR